jgi:NTE family protein
MTRPLLKPSSKQLRAATTYEEWSKEAIRLDEITGKARWKGVDQTRIYDYRSIRERLEQLRDCRQRHDNQALLFALNEGVHGNIGGMGRAELYERALFGTKQLVTEYTQEIVDALDHLAHSDDDGINWPVKLDFFRRASLCFGRSALLLSGGGIYGHFHAGVMLALIREDLLPAVISGASAGSLMAAVVGTHRRDELDAILVAEHLHMEELHRRPAKAAGLSRLLPTLSARDLHDYIARLIPDVTFAEAYERSGIAINISVSPAKVHQTSRLMNAITSPDVHVRSAVLASCSVPGVFPTVQLTARDQFGATQPYLPGTRWVDGSFSDDLPARRLSRLYAVNHYIVSQVNPLALFYPPHRFGQPAVQDLALFCHHSAKNAARLAQGFTDKYMRRWPELRHHINTVTALLTQDYDGDINIYPPPGMVKPRKALQPAEVATVAAFIKAGERATWPRIEMIRNHTAIGHKLDQILARYDNDTLVARHGMPTVTKPRAVMARVV